MNGQSNILHVIEYDYDGDGLLIARTINGVRTNILHDQPLQPQVRLTPLLHSTPCVFHFDQILLEADSSWNNPKQYVNGPFGVLGFVDANGHFNHFLTDSDYSGHVRTVAIATATSVQVQRVGISDCMCFDCPTSHSVTTRKTLVQCA